MPQSHDACPEAERVGSGLLQTPREIFQQPLLWPTTLARVRDAMESLRLNRFQQARVLLTGAGSSAHAASAVAVAWPGALAVPTTDLLVDAERYLLGVDVVISLARSGDSPESTAVVERIRAFRSDILQLAILCNEENALSKSGLDGRIFLDPRTNDRSLVMTSAFSNLALAGLCLAQPEAMPSIVKEASDHACVLLPEIDKRCRCAADQIRDRVVVLFSSPLFGWARESGLKVLEMTAGRFPTITETYLVLRHGPMSFVKTDTFVLCLLSNDPLRRRYEVDLIRELRSKKLGYLVGITEQGEADGLFQETIPAVIPHAPDALRTPYEIVIPQLLGYHLSVRMGINPDNPSPDGIINRVVQGFRIHSSDLDGATA